MYAPYAATTAPVTARMLAHPGLVAMVSRLVTAPGLGRALSGGWAVYWNDLLEGSAPGWPRRTAALAHRLGAMATGRTDERRAILLGLANEDGIREKGRPAGRHPARGPARPPPGHGNAARS